jgi:hypothetical protein
MKAAIAGIAAAIVIAVVGWLALSSIQEPTAERYAVKQSVRL